MKNLNHLVLTLITLCTCSSFAKFATHKDFTCIYTAEKSFSGQQVLLGHLEYDVRDNVPLKSDDREYSEILKKSSFFKNWKNLPSLISHLNSLYYKIPDFADHLVNSSEVFSFQEKKLETNPSIDSNVHMCNGVSSPINQTTDYVLRPIVVINRYSKVVQIDQSSFLSINVTDQVGLIVNVLLNIYSTQDLKESLSSKPFNNLAYQFKLRSVSAMTFDQNLSTDILFEYLQDVLGGISIFSPEKSKFHWTNNSNETCYSHENLNMPVLLQCDLETIRFYEKPTSERAVRRKIQYINYGETKSISDSCSNYSKDYSEKIEDVLNDLDTMNRIVYQWLGSTEIKKICESKKYINDQVITAQGFIFNAKYEFCEGYLYHRTLKVDGRLMNGAYGANTLQSERLGSGGIYNRKAAFFNHISKKSVVFDWATVIDWPKFVSTTKQLRDYFSQFSKDKFRCDEIDINKAYFLRDIGGVN